MVAKKYDFDIDEIHDFLDTPTTVSEIAKYEDKSRGKFRNFMDYEFDDELYNQHLVVRTHFTTTELANALYPDCDTYRLGRFLSQNLEGWHGNTQRWVSGIKIRCWMRVGFGHSRDGFLRDVDFWIHEAHTRLV